MYFVTGGVLKIRWPFLILVVSGRDVTRGPHIFVFWVQPVLLLLDLCSSSADHPEPDPGPVAQPGVLWRPRAHNSGCAAAAKSFQSCPSLCDPMDGSPPGPAVPGVL